MKLEVIYKNKVVGIVFPGQVGRIFKNKRFTENVFLRASPYSEYVTFSSIDDFTLAISDGTKYWDGVLEYSIDRKHWYEWDGTTTLASVDGKLYMRGFNNTQITGPNSTSSKAVWKLSGTEIHCDGNIETLLDCTTVAKGEHPSIGPRCCQYMFYNCTNLVSAPSLEARTLQPYCYHYMFYGCTKLNQAPSLPATELAEGCYRYMFSRCTSLLTSPALKATVLKNSCYQYMFNACTSLKVPSPLPATTLAMYCYQYMYRDCTSLRHLPALKSTNLVNGCYVGMFSGCSEIKLSEVRTQTYGNSYSIPFEDTATVVTNTVTDMFSDTGGTFTGTPSINTTYYTSNTVITYL